jgi:thioredoxin 1
MSEHVRETSDSNFERDVLQSERPVLVDFWAEWCAPCKALTPAVEAVAEMYASRASVVKMNIDNNPSVAQRYGIRGLPTMILFKGGREEERIVGAIGKEKIARMLDKHVTAASA